MRRSLICSQASKLGGEPASELATCDYLQHANALAMIAHDDSGAQHREAGAGELGRIVVMIPAMHAATNRIVRIKILRANYARHGRPGLI